jgi:hypothetical protein
MVAVQDGACACGRVCGAGRRSGGLCLGTGQLERRRRAPPRRGRADRPPRSAPRRSAPKIHAADDQPRGSLSRRVFFVFPSVLLDVLVPTALTGAVRLEPHSGESERERERKGEHFLPRSRPHI